MDVLRNGSLVKARTTTVLITARGEYLVNPHDRPLTRTELLRKRVRFLSEVDMGYHQTRIRSELPCRGDAFGFPATVDLHWRVEDAITVVRDGIRDVHSAVEPGILARLRPITRNFDVLDSEGAERAANQALGRLPEVTQFGLNALAFIRLGMDDAARDRVRMESRVGTYRAIIASGDLSQFALRLAENPKDVADVIALLIKERDAHRHDTVDFVTKLIDSGAIERWEVEDQIRTVLQWLKDTTNRVITGTDEARTASLGADRLTGVDPTTKLPANGVGPSTEHA
ncbi:MAG TPA: hypothetical protein VFW65_26925 [Pseudonocardiaceae bacterium]|nr:hypothetical protein [Pseudonocardiaceae bacterium]